MHIELKRVYEVTAATPGYRVLVDRIWPRGVAKAALALDEWCRDVAPSTALRQWFGHDPARWAAFRRKYRAELQAKGAQLQHLHAIAEKQTLLLLYAAQDQEHNQAVVLREALLAA